MIGLREPNYDALTANRRKPVNQKSYTGKRSLGARSAEIIRWVGKGGDRQVNSWHEVKSSVLQPRCIIVCETFLNMDQGEEKIAETSYTRLGRTRVVKKSYLVNHIMKTAHSLLDEISECNWEELNILSISRKSIVLENEVMMLRPSYPALPLWVDKMLERANEEISVQRSMGIERPKLEPRPPALEMVDWHSHWSEVLRVLESGMQLSGEALAIDEMGRGSSIGKEHRARKSIRRQASRHVNSGQFLEAAVPDGGRGKEEGS